MQRAADIWVPNQLECAQIPRVDRGFGPGSGGNILLPQELQPEWVGRITEDQELLVEEKVLYQREPTKKDEEMYKKMIKTSESRGREWLEDPKKKEPKKKKVKKEKPKTEKVKKKGKIPKKKEKKELKPEKKKKLDVNADDWC